MRLQLFIFFIFLHTILFAGFGALDMSFDKDGKVTTAIGVDMDNKAECVAVQDDGKIVIGGRTGDGTSDDIVLVRYNTDGSLDTNFGTLGVVIQPLQGIESATGITIQKDGKLVVVGWTDDGSKISIVLLRYETSGVLDQSFGVNGVVTETIGGARDEATGVALQKNGKIVVSATSYYGTTNYFATLRYDTKGLLDGSFQGGIVLKCVGSISSESSSIAIQKDQKIILAGSSFNGNDWEFALVRFDLDGTLDENFGTKGVVIGSIGGGNDFSSSLLVQEDRMIVIAGFSFDGTRSNFTLQRYGPEGTLDGSFGVNGTIISHIGSGHSQVNGIVYQKDGKIIAAGNSSDGTGDMYTLVRYDSDGLLDTKFGNNGITKTKILGVNDNANSIALQGDGKVVLAGSSAKSTDYDISLARYLIATPPLAPIYYLLQ